MRVAAAGLLLVLLCAALYLPGIGSVPFHSKGEPREALAVREIVRRGEWVLPLRNGTEIPSKPLLFHWLAAAAAKARGALDEASLRLPSAAAATLGVLLAFAMARRRSGVAAGLLAGAVLATSGEWLRAARVARVDMVHAACLAGVLAALDGIFTAPATSARWRRLLWAIAGICSGLATLAKGPVGLVIPALAAGALVLLRWNRVRPGWRDPLLALGLAVGIAGWWYVAAAVSGGRAFVDKQLLAENFQRYLGTKGGHGSHVKPAAYYVGAVAAGFAPWTLLAPLAAAGLAGRRVERAAWWVVPAVWFLVVVGFYSLSAGKRSVYVLAAYPALAVLFAVGWEAWARGRAGAVTERRWLAAGLRWAAGVCGGVPVVLVLGEAIGAGTVGRIAPLLHQRDRANVVLVAEAVRADPWAALLLVAGTAAAVWVCADSAVRGRWYRACVAVVAVVVLGTWLAARTVLPAMGRARSFRSFFAEEVLPRVGAGDRVILLRTFSYGAVWYADRNLEVVEDLPAPAGGRIWVLVADRVWDTLGEGTRRRLRPVAASAATDPRGRWRLVLALVTDTHSASNPEDTHSNASNPEDTHSNPGNPADGHPGPTS